MAATYRSYKPEHPLTSDQQFSGRLERLAGTVGGEERPGLRVLRHFRPRRRERRRSTSTPTTKES